MGGKAIVELIIALSKNGIVAAQQRLKKATYLIITAINEIGVLVVNPKFKGIALIVLSLRAIKEAATKNELREESDQIDLSIREFLKLSKEQGLVKETQVAEEKLQKLNEKLSKLKQK